MLGLITRGYQLFLCCSEMLAEGNWNGFYTRAKGLLETICAAAWALHNVERLPSLVRQEQVVPGKMLNAGRSKGPYLNELCRELNTLRAVLLSFVAELREFVSLKEHSIRAGTVMAELRPRWRIGLPPHLDFWRCERCVP